MKSLLSIIVGVLLCQVGLAQQLLWQYPTPPSTDRIYGMGPFVDFNQDGYRDMLLLNGLRGYDRIDGGGGGHTTAVEIRSGLDATVLWLAVDNKLSLEPVNVGDVNGDGRADIAMRKRWQNYHLEVWSPSTNQLLWQVIGPFSGQFGDAILGDLDVNGDGLKDVITITSHSSDSRVFAYSNQGTLLYTIPILAQYGRAVSLGKLGDMNGDGRDDFLVGVNDFTTQGVVLMVSGANGAVLRTSVGLQPGDKTCDFVRSLGDIDADGVEDYAGFPWLTASRGIVVAWSGATGQVIRTWDEFANSVITGEDFDLDGVPDMAIGADWTIAPNLYGSTRVYSGRDGLELWRIDNAPFQPAGQGSTGFFGWMEYSASLGVRPGDRYPTIAWLDVDWIMYGTDGGRIRAFRTAYAQQGPITGTPCSSTGQQPLIGARKHQVSATQQRARITVARGPAGAGAWLNVAPANQTSFGGAPLPIDLSAYGLSGCSLHVGPVASAFTVLGTTGIDAGYGFIDLAQRLSTTTAGLPIAAQWLLFDPTTLAYGTTAKHQLLLQ